VTLLTKDEKRDSAVAEVRRTVATRPGMNLKNGCVILQHSALVRESDFGFKAVVLAIDTAGGYQPFVVWRRLAGVQTLSSGEYGPIDYCVYGDYFVSLQDALDCFLERVGVEIPDA